MACHAPASELIFRRLAKPSLTSSSTHLLVVELWGLGDLALAIPFLRTAAAHTRVTLLAKPHAAPLLARFAPGIELVPLIAPWTAFRSKYRLLRWPWRELARTRGKLRAQRIDFGISARRDPRDHALLALAGARRRLGFPRAGSGIFLSDSLAAPARPHRAEYWRSLASALGWDLPPSSPPGRTGRRIVVHTGAGQPTRTWPRERFENLAAHLRDVGWEVVLLDDSLRNVDHLLTVLASADRFIGNDSGPGHLAALLGVPTFTIFGPSLPELFSTLHPDAGWIEGAACRYRPCWDYCRYAEPRCIRAITVEQVWTRLDEWLKRK